MTRFGLSQATIDTINQIFKKYPAITKVIIYGSRAMGTYKNGSDIDLTIIDYQLKDQDYTQLFVDLDDLFIPYTFDLSLYREIDNEDLKAHIQRVGQVFYERDEYHSVKADQ